MTDGRLIGAGPYSGQARSKPQRFLEKFMEKCKIRAELCRLQAELDAELHSLNPLEIEQLRQLMESGIATADDDAETLRRQISEEAELAKTTKSAQICMSRKATAILAVEARRRIAKGIFPSSESMVAEAIEAAYA